MEADVIDRFVVFPNPVTNKTIINFYVDTITEQKTGLLNFYDLKGSFVRSEAFQIINPLDPVELDVSFLIPGSYILTYVIDNETKKSKLIVQ